MSENARKETTELHFIATPREELPINTRSPGRSSVAPASPPATQRASDRVSLKQNCKSLQRRLQPINQLLHILFTQRLQQSARDRHKSSKNLRLALPEHFGSTVHRQQIESRLE